MKNYEILYKSNDYYFVVIKSVYSVGEIIKNFIADHIKNSNFSGKIVFDLLLSSTSWYSEDRFWKFSVNNGIIDFNSKKYCKPDLKYVEIADNYFSINFSLINGSILINKSSRHLQ